MGKNMTNAEIREFNNKVKYNQSGFSWLVDIIGCLIAWPMIVMVIYRRSKYNRIIEYKL